MKCPDCAKNLYTEIHDDKTLLKCECGYSRNKNYLKVNQIYAYFSVNQDDDIEGLACFFNDDALIPMIAADKHRLDELTLIAHDMVEKEGLALRLVKFTNREEIKTIQKTGSTTNDGR